MLVRDMDVLLKIELARQTQLGRGCKIGFGGAPGRSAGRRTRHAGRVRYPEAGVAGARGRGGAGVVCCKMGRGGG